MAPPPVSDEMKPSVIVVGVIPGALAVRPDVLAPAWPTTPLSTDAISVITPAAIPKRTNDLLMFPPAAFSTAELSENTKDVNLVTTGSQRASPRYVGSSPSRRARDPRR